MSKGLGIRRLRILPDSFSSTVNDLPTIRCCGDNVPFNNSFLLVGGVDDTGVTDNILAYIPDNDSWMEMPSKLNTPKQYPTVIPVKRSIFPSC